MRPYSNALKRLKFARLRPTRQRLALAKILLDEKHRHITAEQLHSEVIATGIRISLATVYNTLHQFTRAGLLREVVVEPGRTYFDTNIAEHYHIFDQETGVLSDVPNENSPALTLPMIPDGMEIDRVDVMVRIKRTHGV